MKWPDRSRPRDYYALLPHPYQFREHVIFLDLAAFMVKLELAEGYQQWRH